MTDQPAANQTTKFPQPRRNDGGVPCGECPIQPGETCDICGAAAKTTDLPAAIAKSRARTLAAAKSLSRLMAEFDGDISCSGEALTELLDAADQLATLEAMEP